MDAASEPVQVTLSRGLMIALAAFGVIAIGFFGVAGYVFVDQLATIKDQNSKQAELIQKQEPLIAAALPVLREARRQAGPAREVTRRTRRLLRTSVPLTEELAEAGLPRVVREVGAFSRTLLPLAQEIRDRSLVERSSIVLGQTRLALRALRETRLIARVPRALDALIRRQDKLLRIQEETLGIQRRLIVTQDEALVRLREIENRLGGSLEDAIRP